MVSVLHVTQPVTAGVAGVVFGLAASQAAEGHDVAVACPAGPLSDKLTAAGIRWQRWDAERQPGAGLPDERSALKRIVGDCAPDLVHLHSSKAGLVGRLVLRGRIPTVFQPHAWSFFAARGKTQFAATRWERYATRWTDLTLFCSRREQEQGLAYGIAGRGRVVLNGIDLRRFAVPTEAERGEARKMMGLPEDAFVAAVIGRRSEQKGQDIAERSWKEVRSSNRSAVLVLMGEGYENGFDGTRGILTRAPSDNVRPAYVASDVLLSPSRWEGLSLSLIEGLATGRPAIATDVSGSREALVDGPLPPAGAVVETENAEALTAEIRNRLKQPELILREGMAARRRAEVLFDETLTEVSVMDTYQLLLGGSHARQEYAAAGL